MKKNAGSTFATDPGSSEDNCKTSTNISPVKRFESRGISVSIPLNLAPKCKHSLFNKSPLLSDNETIKNLSNHELKIIELEEKNRDLNSQNSDLRNMVNFLLNRQL